MIYVYSFLTYLKNRSRSSVSASLVRTGPVRRGGVSASDAALLASLAHVPPMMSYRSSLRSNRLSPVVSDGSRRNIRAVSAAMPMDIVPYNRAVSLPRRVFNNLDAVIGSPIRAGLRAGGYHLGNAARGVVDAGFRYAIPRVIPWAAGAAATAFAAARSQRLRDQFARLSGRRNLLLMNNRN